jgi:hypothetical protein
MHQPDQPAFRRLGRGMADRQAGGAAGEAAIGDQRAGLAEALRLQIAGRIEHFLHAGAAARPFVADDDDIAGLDLVGQDRLDAGVLAFEHPGRAGEFQDRFIDARGLHDTAVERQVAFQHGKATILGKRILGRADDTLLPVEIEFVPAAILAEGDLRRHAARGRQKEVADILA